MTVNFDENKIILDNAFDLKKTFECGQCFRFDATDTGFRGVAHGKLLSLVQKDNRIEITGITKSEFEDIFYNYFDLGTDYDTINGVLSQDAVLKDIIPFSNGIRILRQDPFETLISFIISSSNNIPRIKKIIKSLCENFGKKYESCGEIFYSFPSADTLAGLQVCDLAVIRAGYRDKYILDCAKKVASGELDIDRVRTMTYADACKELMKVNGIGQKVADCALLFGFGFSESFPKDVWIKRVLRHFYNTEDNRDLDFYGYDGIAQQYLFYFARENKIGEK